MDAWFESHRPALSSIRDLESTEIGFFYESADGNLVFEDRHHRLKGDHLVSQVTLSDASSRTLPYEIPYTEVNEDNALSEIYNEVRVQVQTYSTGGTSVLWTLGGSNPTIAAGRTRTWWATYPGPDTPEGAYVDSWVTPVVGTDITQTGVSNSDIAVSATKFATEMKIEVTNNHATDTATITLLQARGDPVTKDSPAVIRASDSTSQADYGERSFTLAGKWLPDSNTATDSTNYYVSRYKDPLPFLDVSLAANHDESTCIQALTRDLSDVVTVVAENNSQLGISQDYFIEAIGHRVEPGKLHTTTWTLSPVTGDQAYWVLGTSALGLSTKLGF